MKIQTGTQKHSLDEEIRQAARECLAHVYAPTSVYRLQFNRDFTFKKATEVVPQLAEMGIGAVYCSPYFESLPGSGHGYDITNPNKINPELGSRVDYDLFCESLKRHGLGHIVDVVPNHMSILGTQNHWWIDVLENGQNSIYARFFDIDWKPEKKEIQQKVLLPILGDAYGQILQDGEIQLQYDPQRKGFFVHYWEHRLPISPRSYPVILEGGIRELASRCHETDRDYLELLSVITAFKNLPEDVNDQRLKILERNREKEIAKERLAQLIQKSNRIAEYIRDRQAVFNGPQGDPQSFRGLHQLLEEQYYRLSFWRVASEEINYRRFFDVNALAAIRVEDEETFERYHALLFHLLEEGKIQGLRIDHTDGLYDPPGYLKKLQGTHLLRRVFQAIHQKDPTRFADKAVSQDLITHIEAVLSELEFTSKPSVYLVVEKILERKEQLPEEWMVHGTVGYDFLNSLNGLFIQQDHEKQISELYADFAKLRLDFSDLLYERKKFYALIHMASEINALGHRLDLISEANPYFRDFTRNNLALAIREVIACFPVYRTYISPEDTEVSRSDAKYIHIAIEKAKQKTPALSSAIYDFLEDILRMKYEVAVSEAEKRGYRDFVLRFQQLTGPVMAKGLEDTVFYVYNRFLSLNEVGGSPVHFGCSVAEFHRQNTERNRRWPQSFITTTTHDTKRSEDVRLRLNVLSEIPKTWKSQVSRWSIFNKKHKTLLDKELTPDRNTEYFIYQTLLGLWPSGPLSEEKCRQLQKRAWSIILKSIREAKTETNWLRPDEEYEAAVKRFVMQMTRKGSENQFLEQFLKFKEKVNDFGMLNSISSCVLKIGSPGVVDIYQGSEFWDDRFVDPDNRRSVDFGHAASVLEEFKAIESAQDRPQMVRDLFKDRGDGRIKLFLLKQGLRQRKETGDLFVGADYIPLEVRGRRQRHCVAWIRRSGREIALIAAARFYCEIAAKTNGAFLGEDAWRGTWIVLPKEFRALSLKDIFSGEVIRSEQKNKKGMWLIPVWRLFQDLPAAILTNTFQDL